MNHTNKLFLLLSILAISGSIYGGRVELWNLSNQDIYTVLITVKPVEPDPKTGEMVASTETGKIVNIKNDIIEKETRGAAVLLEYNDNEEIPVILNISSEKGDALKLHSYLSQEDGGSGAVYLGGNMKIEVRDFPNHPNGSGVKVEIFLQQEDGSWHQFM